MDNISARQEFFQRLALLRPHIMYYFVGIDSLEYCDKHASPLLIMTDHSTSGQKNLRYRFVEDDATFSYVAPRYGKYADDAVTPEQPGALFPQAKRIKFSLVA